jgi:hypothetical protein
MYALAFTLFSLFKGGKAGVFANVMMCPFVSIMVSLDIFL